MTFTRDQKRKIGRCLKRLTAHLYDRLERRQRIASLLRERVAPDGRVYLDVWQRDCDHLEVSEILDIEPTAMAYERFVDEIYDGAEGPVRITILKPEDIEHWEPVWRDVAAAMEGY